MRVLVIGGAGFIGINSANYFAKKGYEVIIIDDLSRVGTDKNLLWLQSNFNVKFIKQDIRDFNGLNRAISDIGVVDAVLLLAAQVAVTTSISDPRLDFEINCLGTFNVLESLRNNQMTPLLIYSSTNKVYGGMEEVAIEEYGGRYLYRDLPNGIDEHSLLDFHSPYGCSKGAAEQYVRDYSRIYGMPTTVFRQSCIYGERQFGVEDQGWVAWFTIAAALERPIKVYGDGKQVRDVLFVEDLVKAYELAIINRDVVNGKIFNVGGGAENTLSLLELISLLEKFFGRKINHSFHEWRKGDQPVYISNINKIQSELGWVPTTNISKGIECLSKWVHENSELFQAK